VTRQLLPALRSGSGAIVMVASVAADRAPSGAAAYAVSKAGMAMLGYVLAVEEVGRTPVRCNVVNPVGPEPKWPIVIWERSPRRTVST